MEVKIVMKHRYRLGQICVFKNHSETGITSNDGKACEITRLKPVDEWAQGEPEYAIGFVNENHGFGCRECELVPIN